MTSRTSLLAFAALAFAACTDNTGAPAPSGGGSAAAMGEDYCETTPTDPAELASWEQLCMPDDRGRR